MPQDIANAINFRGTERRIEEIKKKKRAAKYKEITFWSRSSITSSVRSLENVCGNMIPNFLCSYIFHDEQQQGGGVKGPVLLSCWTAAPAVHVVEPRL